MIRVSDAWLTRDPRVSQVYEIANVVCELQSFLGDLALKLGAQ